MARITEESYWEWEPTQLELDSEGYEVGEYKLSGSVPLSFYELMILRSEGVSGTIDLDNEHLR